MTRFEFTKKLRQALSGRVSHTIVNENVAYYENYIDTEIKKGRKEAEILEELGDPRLIAKTIIDTAGEEGQSAVGETGARQRGFAGRVFRLPLWIGILILLIVFLVVFKIVGFVIGLLLPFALPLALIVLVIRYFRRR